MAFRGAGVRRAELRPSGAVNLQPPVRQKVGWSAAFLFPFSQVSDFVMRVWGVPGWFNSVLCFALF